MEFPSACSIFAFSIQYFKDPRSVQTFSIFSSRRECQWWWWWCYDIFVNKLIKKPQRKYPHAHIHTHTIVNFIYHNGFVVEVNNKCFENRKLRKIYVYNTAASSAACALCPVCKPQEHHIFKWKPNAANTLHPISHPFRPQNCKANEIFQFPKRVLVLYSYSSIDIGASTFSLSACSG